jgi:hypothetical protein
MLKKFARLYGKKPVCVGIGKTLTLAKVANHVAKSGLGLMVSVYLMMIALKERCLRNYHRLMCGALAEKPMPN